MFRKKHLEKFDYLLFLSFLFLIFSGFITIYGATYFKEESFLKKQIYWFLIGISFFVIFLYYDYTIFKPLSRILYVLNISLLIAGLILGKTVGGSQRWINIGFFTIQPSEFAKIFIIISLAEFFSRREEKIEEFSTLLLSLGYIALPLILIFKQPDLGTSFSVGTIWLGMVFIAGGRTKHLVYLIMGVIFSSPLLWNFLKDYQKKRLLIFLDPDVDPLEAGYHLIQSKIAIGSGGIFGKGISSAFQSKLNFIPAHHTDFIFSTLAEIFGFVGVSLILLFYTILLIRGIRIMNIAKDNFGKLICAGIISMWIFHIFVNIGMTVGIMPITGIPLPFVSYGGSSLLTNIIATSLLLNIGMRYKTLEF